VQIVLNYEEGGENNILHGDMASEAFLSEIVSAAAPWPGQRHWNMESIYEYGARAGFWRLHRMLARPAGDGLRRRHGAGARARTGGRDEGGRAGRSPATG
jgi:hypothetical protein